MSLDGTHQKKVCPNCGKEIQVASFNRHYKACVNGYKKKEPKHKVILTEDLICPFCEKQFKNKNSYRQHYIRCPKNPDRDAADNLSNYITNNRKGKNKYNCPEIAKQVATMRDKYDNGYVSPCKGVSTEHDYIYQEQNQEEINKWLEYISNMEITEDYETKLHPEGYKYLTKTYYKVNNSRRSVFEHDYVANILLGGQLSDSNCVHHINRNRSDNSKNNLMIFVDGANHKRFHNSKYAKLIYNSETHLFSCIIDK